MPFCRDFALRDQIRRAAISTMSNIAEGFERDGKQEFIQFLAIAKGSVGEIQSQLYVARDQGFLREVDFEEIFAASLEVGRTLAGLMRYLRSASIRGNKYAAPRTRN
jgi:four helix bundle protein